ncbi:MAG TPA: GGDEF domain-containing protein [Sphingobium sp.]|nr:GGDEF domain-containing protein [Sphingobium sp.]
MNHRSPAEAVEVELIRSLFDAFVPSVIMTLVFLLAGVMAARATGDPVLVLLLLGGALVSVVRLWAAWSLAPAARRQDLTFEEARRLERRFAWPYHAYALLLGLFGVRAMLLPFAQVHMAVVCLLMGYAAGVAAGIGLRPRIASVSMIISLMPASLTAMLMGDTLYLVTGVLATSFLGGGIYSLRGRHERARKDIMLRFAFANLARQDALTALPNRVALHEWFDERAGEAGARAQVAVHYVDLNGFKPINDGYGHPVGDALLAAVGKRIAHTIRAADMAARLGGDEFAVVQYGVESIEEAQQLAERLVAAIALPFQIEGHDLQISTSVGYVVGSGAEGLDELLGLADKALYISKRGGDVVTRYEASLSVQPRAFVDRPGGAIHHGQDGARAVTAG